MSRATRSNLPRSGCRLSSIRGRRSFRRFSLGTPLAGHYYAPLGATQNSGEASFPQNNGSLTVDVNKTFKTHIRLGRVYGRLANRRRRQTHPDSIQFLESP